MLAKFVYFMYIHGPYALNMHWIKTVIKTIKVNLINFEFDNFNLNIIVFFYYLGWYDNCWHLSFRGNYCFSEHAHCHDE